MKFDEVTCKFSGIFLKFELQIFQLICDIATWDCKIRHFNVFVHEPYIVLNQIAIAKTSQYCIDVIANQPSALSI